MALLNEAGFLRVIHLESKVNVIVAGVTIVGE